MVLRVPLRLALTEHPSDEESNTLVYDGAPWSVRLAAKLLRLRAAGSASPWYPYLQVGVKVDLAGTVAGSGGRRGDLSEEASCPPLWGSLRAGLRDLAFVLSCFTRQTCAGCPSLQPSPRPLRSCGPLTHAQVLPEVVPCPHTTFSWEDIEAIQYAPMRRDLDFGNWVATSALAQLSPAATGGAAGEGLHWALSVQLQGRGPACAPFGQPCGVG